MHARPILFTVALLLSVLISPPVMADALTFNLRNDHPNAVSVEFYSLDRDVSWPGGGEVFVLDDGNEQSFPLECEAGEMICFGAWVQGDESQYWGAGPGGEQACEDCCYSCENADTPLRILRQ